MLSVRVRSILRLFLLISSALFPALAQTNPYESTIRAFEAADRVSRPPANSIVFVGSSSIVNWSSLAADFPRYHVLNRGFGGSSTPDALFFFDRIVTPYRPPVVAFYEGDNDIASGRTVDQVYNDWLTFVSRVRANLPNTHILYISVKPSPSRSADLPEQRELNQRVRDFVATDPKLHFADVFTPMLTASGDFRPELYVSDQLHMTPAGYAIWKSVVGPILDQIAASYPIQITRSEANGLLLDVGGEQFPSGEGASVTTHWNNISTAIGTVNTGVLNDLVTAAGLASTVDFKMVSRFNGANENGAQTSTNFPASATRDSLFGNTEPFSGQTNVTPIFKFIGLEPSASYRFTFYASRTGASDNRQTRYTVTGAATASADLNAANNVEQMVSINDVFPDEAGEITIRLTPGPANNNGNHFTYLNVLRLERTAGTEAFLFDFGSPSSLTPTQTSAGGFAWNNLMTGGIL